MRLCGYCCNMFSRHSARFAHIMFTDSLHILFLSLWSGNGPYDSASWAGSARYIAEIVQVRPCVRVRCIRVLVFRVRIGPAIVGMHRLEIAQRGRFGTFLSATPLHPLLQHDRKLNFRRFFSAGMNRYMDQNHTITTGCTDFRLVFVRSGLYTEVYCFSYKR